MGEPALREVFDVVRLLKRKRIATLDDLKQALGKQADATAFPEPGAPPDELLAHRSYVRRRQVLSRKSSAIAADMAAPYAHKRVTSDELKAAIVLFFSLLDERQRRLYAGFESL